MNVLSLFTGAGGGELAFQHLLTGFRTIGYVEIDDYCQRVIAQRIKDGLLDNAEIYGDIRTFIAEGYAEAYQGQVDVITAGFPCQPFSVAGKQLAEKDNRNLWPETIKTIRIVKPATVFLENVPGLLASEYALTIFRQLRENGYQTLPPLRLGADDIGANHRRKRAWIVAHSGNGGASKRTGKGRTESIRDNEGNGKTTTDSLPTPLESSSLANPNKWRSQPGNDHAGREEGSISGGRCEGAEVANSDSSRKKPSRNDCRMGGSGNPLRTPENMSVKTGALNPPWVEWLMGWPIGWTDLKPLAMDKFRKWLRLHGRY